MYLPVCVCVCLRACLFTRCVSVWCVWVVCLRIPSRTLAACTGAPCWARILACELDATLSPAGEDSHLHPHPHMRAHPRARSCMTGTAPRRRLAKRLCSCDGLSRSAFALASMAARHSGPNRQQDAREARRTMKRCWHGKEPHLDGLLADQAKNVGPSSRSAASSLSCSRPRPCPRHRPRRCQAVDAHVRHQPCGF